MITNSIVLYLCVWQGFVLNCTFLLLNGSTPARQMLLGTVPFSLWVVTHPETLPEFPSIPSHKQTNTNTKPGPLLAPASGISLPDALFARPYHRDAVVAALLLPGLCDWSNLTHSATRGAPNASAVGWDRKRFIKYRGLERNSCPSKRHRQEIILLWNKWADYGNMWVYA